VRNVVLLKVEMTSDFEPLSPKRCVATFNLFASEKNTQDAVLSDGKGVEIDLPAGVQFRFEEVDLSQLFLRSKGGEVVFVIGHTA